MLHKDISSVVSLNECQIVDPVVQSTGFDILLRFRTHQIVIAADIEKMYKQVLLDERDVPFQLIFWREDSTADLRTYAIIESGARHNIIQNQ